MINFDDLERMERRAEIEVTLALAARVRVCRACGEDLDATAHLVALESAHAGTRRVMLCEPCVEWLIGQITIPVRLIIMT